MAATAVSDQVTPVEIAPAADDGRTRRSHTGDDRTLPDVHIRHAGAGPHAAGRTARPSAIDNESDRGIARLAVADELSSLPADQRRMLELAFYDGPARLKARWEVDDASRPRSAGAAGAG
jgi:hypothetical protein